jgi:hypothetical protein
MKIEQYITFAMTIVAIAVCTFAIKDEITHSKEHQERFDALVRDSVKMHKWYENVHLNYQELNNLRP